MCTIGTARDGLTRTFKQCDLTDPTAFSPPEVATGQAGRYFALRRADTPGIWAGANDHGVAFVAADNYTRAYGEQGQTADPSSWTGDVSQPKTSTHQGDRPPWVTALFGVYEQTVSACSSAEEAARVLASFYLYGNEAYQGHFPSADITLVSDAESTFYIEYSPVGDFTYDRDGTVTGTTAEGTGEVRLIQTTAPLDPTFVSTNNNRLFNTAVTFPMNPSTFLRLQRATQILGLSPDHAGVHQLLADQYYGETERSICRVAPAGLYHTQASVIFSVGDGEVVCEYIVNANPRSGSWASMTLPLQ